VEPGDVLCQQDNALDLERLHERAQQAVTLEQRHALACELHDSVMQTLFSLHLATQVALDSWEHEPAQARAAMEMVLRLTCDARTEMRTLLFELRDNVLESEGLLCALSQYVDLVSHHSGLRIDLQLPRALSLPPSYCESLYRAVREGLTNVVKFAQAQHASVILSADEAGISLRIEDDGIGFRTADPECTSCGLRLLRERLRTLGGTLRLGNCPQGGASISIALPVPREPQQPHA
jgi:NarL family two-component system sensor histidine kinase LiaS